MSTFERILLFAVSFLLMVCGLVLLSKKKDHEEPLFAIYEDGSTYSIGKLIRITQGNPHDVDMMIDTLGVHVWDESLGKWMDVRLGQDPLLDEFWDEYATWMIANGYDLSEVRVGD